VTEPTVRRERLDARVTQVTLQRPDQLNAITFGLVGELHDALDEVAGDPECRVVILTGAGRAFCAGLDLRDWGTPPEPGEHPHAQVGVGGQEFLANLTVHIRRTPQIVVAAVNGPAFGGGLSLACAADLRIASDAARFCSAFIRTGLSGTDAGISYLLPQIIGGGRAFDLIVTGREVDAPEAERIGLVSRVVAPDALLDESKALAEQIAGYTRTGLVLTKEAFWHNVDTPNMAAAIALENRNQRIAGSTPEVQEYMASYSQRHRDQALQ
jgi:enoyl-CoA hydratase